MTNHMHNVTRSMMRARKAFARAVAYEDEAETPKAAKRATRRAKAARRSLLEG